MNDFFAELRKAREEKHLSLADIAGVTLISEDKLGAIEEGNTSILPEPYVRAFIREYASVVGLDPAETLRKFDEARRPPQVLVPQKKEQETSQVVSNEIPSREKQFDLKKVDPRVIRGSIAVLVLAGLALGMWGLFNRDQQAPVEEIPFQSTIKETEQRILGDTISQAARKPPTSAPRDSLLLSAITTDSVWVHIVIDNQQPLEYLFGPQRRMNWKASERFMLILGNGGAIEFTLNGKQIGVLGQRGSVVRNAELTRENLARK